MNYKMIGRFLGLIVSVEAVFLLPALGISLGYGEWIAARSLVNDVYRRTLSFDGR